LSSPVSDSAPITSISSKERRLNVTQSYDSPWAKTFARLAGLSWLGFLGFLGLLGFLGFIPGCERLFGLAGLSGLAGLFGFAGFYGVASWIERNHRRKASHA
jgi:hypothetical protein